jgi:hypothetical protein
MKSLTILLAIFFSFFGYTQTQEVAFEINWDDKNNRCLPCDFDPLSQNVISVQTEQLYARGNNQFTTEIIKVEYKNIEIPALIDRDKISSEEIINTKVSKSGRSNFLNLIVSPIINQNGLIKIVSKVKVKVTYESDNEIHNRAATFASESVLKSGSWYKFGVSKSGVYKIDKTFLELNGINTSSLNPKHINIYANHQTHLPISNNEYHPDDLIKNSISVVGESDGVFNENDYILFYATGPQVVVNDIGNGFDLFTNNYDTLNYFYLSIDSADPPKRIQGLNNSASTVTNNVTSTNSAVLYEVEDTNIVKSGNVWLGELFDIDLTQNINVQLPGVVVGSPILMDAKVGVKKASGSAVFNFGLNGLNVNSVSVTNNSSNYSPVYTSRNEVSFTSASSSLGLSVEFVRSSASTIGWLDRMQFNYRRSLSLASGQFLCRDWESVGAGNVALFSVSSAVSNSQVWEVTDPTNSISINSSFSNGTLSFIQNTDSLRSFVLFSDVDIFTDIEFVGVVNNQNLHALPQADYVIVTHSKFQSQADRLAKLHRDNGLLVHVVDIQDVYNEFSSGVADPVSIRWLMKMFYDRGLSDGSLMPSSLLLFGDGSFDSKNHKSKNSAYLPTFQSRHDNASSISYISSFTSDDFFGMLDDLESMDASDLIDVGIGRFPVQTEEEAKAIVDKIEHYMNYGSDLFSGIGCGNDGFTSTFGDWRTRSVLIADDQNFDKFVLDCEALSNLVEDEHNEMNTTKIYLDAYQQVSTSGGQRYPDVEVAINQMINQGALVFNYVGHGGETGLALERIISIPQINEWSNINKLPLFISATCEFSRFDDPGRTSAGELMLLAPNGGAVAMLTTTRLVYISTNSTLVKNLYSLIYDETNGEPYSMGEIIRLTKNLTAGDNNMRNFTLLGDPALKLGKPRPNIIIDSLNGVSITESIDTLKSLSKIRVTGHLEDYLGNSLSNYNGIAYPTVFDKYKQRSTLGQDSDSGVQPFDVQNNILYKGKSTVKNGQFSFEFIVPKDIDYAFGKGKISCYSENGITDKIGFDTTIVVGGIDPNGISDDVGPEIELFMNDENFVDGGVTDTKPLFVAKVADENGINTSGNGIGHDIVVIIDGETSKPIILNNFYESDLDTYKSGQINYQFLDLEEGEHQLTLKIWDVNNNSSEASLDFVVTNSDVVEINHLLNYPNPFTTHTEFYFEHNQLHNISEARIEIFTVTGKLVKTIFEDVTTCAYRSEGIPWDGRDEYGDKLARGVYVYRLTVKTIDGKSSEKIEKLYIL